TLIDKDTAGVVVQYPNFFGGVEDMTEIAEMIHAVDGLLTIITTEAVSLGMLKTPGEMNADIFVGEGQSFGNPMNFGGPHLGLFATRQKFLRNLPGRIVGQTTDADSKRGFVLTMATREQHIRREKATSNICTNQGLCALAFTIHLALLGREGLEELSRQNFNKAQYARKVLTGPCGALLKFTSPTFNEFVLQLSRDAEEIVNKLVKKDIFAGIPLGKFYPELKDCLLVCVTEAISKEEIDLFASELKKVL
ncbi:glycine dehydrogenase, partial [bacterium]|nr:glycine dehydrogenase [bacterium]